MGVLRATLFLAGLSIGAGFVSGAELVFFLGSQRIIGGIALFTVAYFFMCRLILSLGKKYGGYDGAIDRLFGKCAKIVRRIFPLFSLIPCAGMLSGLDGLLPQCAPLFSCFGILVALIVLQYGIRGISVVSVALVPILIAAIVCNGRGVSWTYPMQQTVVLGGLQYAGMNVFLSLPTLFDAGMEIKSIWRSSLAASVLVGGTAAAVLGRIMFEGAGAIQANFPLLYVMKGDKLYFFLIAIAVFSSLTSAIYGLFRGSNDSGRATIAMKAVLLGLAFVLSRFGWNRIIRYCYPLLGFLGIVFSLFCIFYEYFFKQYDKKIHSGGKQAQYHRCGHYKIEAKHLPTVDDKIAEPGARNDIFSHD